MRNCASASATVRTVDERSRSTLKASASRAATRSTGDTGRGQQAAQPLASRPSQSNQRSTTATRWIQLAGGLKASGAPMSVGAGRAMAEQQCLDARANRLRDADRNRVADLPHRLTTAADELI